MKNNGSNDSCRTALNYGSFLPAAKLFPGLSATNGRKRCTEQWFPASDFTSIKIYKSYKKCAKNIIKLSFQHDFKIVRKFPRTGEHFISQRVYKVALIQKTHKKHKTNAGI